MECKSLKELKKIELKTKKNLLDNCYLRLVNKNNIPNGKNLNDIPYRNYMDLAIVYSIQYNYLQNGKKVTESCILSNEDLKQYKITKEELEHFSKINMEENNRVRLQSFLDYSMAENNAMAPITHVPENLLNSIVCTDIPNGMNKISANMFCNNNSKKDVLIISNRFNSYASIYMTDFNILSKVSTIFNQESFYIIPMSVHKLMCIRKKFATKNGEKEIKDAEIDLADMLENLNDTMNKDDIDILSYHIYLFDTEDQCILRI